MAVRLLVLEPHDTTVRHVSIASVLGLVQCDANTDSLAQKLSNPADFFRVDIDCARRASERASLRVDGTLTLHPFCHAENCNPSCYEAICRGVRDGYLRLCEDLKKAPATTPTPGASIVFRIV